MAHHTQIGIRRPATQRLVVACAAFELLEPRALMAVGALSEQLIVDPIGYRASATQKFAIFADPITGQNAAVAYTPGATFQVRKSSDDSVVFTGNTVSWKSGQTDTVSGDKVWTGDFSSVTAPGEYYLYDATNNLRSYAFKLDNTLYNDILKTSDRTFYYQRTGTAIDAAHGGNWTHAIDHVGPNQDTQARFWQNGAVVPGSPVRNLSGGWFDAGDYNKYVPFTTGVLWNLLNAYEWNPGAAGDDTNIPESGNGVPDTLDEIRYELNWLLKMQNPNGSVLNRVSNATYNSGNSDPSTDTQPRYYTAPTTWATASFAASTAHASRVYRQFDPAYADTLLAASRAAWANLNGMPGMTPPNGSDGGTGLASAAAGSDGAGDLRLRILASAELFKTTGEGAFKTYFDANARNPAASDNGQHPLLGGYKHFDPSLGADLNRAFVTYATSTAATDPTFVADIKSSLRTFVDDQILGNVSAQSDPYRSFMYEGHYTWGSNQLKSEWANLLTCAIKLNVNSANTTRYRDASEEYLHYLHGRNPLSQTYLSNVGAKGVDLGAEKSVMEVYHSWFGDGSKYDGAGSQFGPVPGYLVGGANKYFSVSWITPPYGEPAMKAFNDWNTAWNPTKQANENSWEITEPAIYYQAAYQLLLSQFATDTHAPHAMSSTFDVNAAPHAIKIKFDEDVGATLTVGDLDLKNMTTNTTILKSLYNVTFDAATRTATFTYTGNASGILPDGDYHATIAKNGVTDPAGNPLAADVSLDFFVLAGDINHDRTVNFDDLVLLSQSYGLSGRSFAQGNLDYSSGGEVNFDDLVILSQRYGSTLGTAPIIAPIVLAPMSVGGGKKSAKTPLAELQ